LQGGVGQLSASRWRTALLWAPSVAVAAAIFALSSIPGTAFPVVHFSLADKVVHGSIYALFSALLAIPLSARNVKRPVLSVMGIACLYGISDELHQIFTPFRSADPWDVVADTVGGLIGGLTYVAIARWRRPR
jgi:VanZ family protein